MFLLESVLVSHSVLTLFHLLIIRSFCLDSVSFTCSQHSQLNTLTKCAISWTLVAASDDITVHQQPIGAQLPYTLEHSAVANENDATFYKQRRNLMLHSKFIFN